MFCLLVKFDLLQEFVFVPCGLFFSIVYFVLFEGSEKKINVVNREDV